MTEDTPYADTTYSRWVVQEYNMNAWMERTGLEDEAQAQRALAARRLQHPELVYRLVEEVVHKTRFVRVAANEPGAPLPEEDVPDKMDSSVQTTEGQPDDDAGDERGPSGLGEAEAGEEDGAVQDPRLPV